MSKPKPPAAPAAALSGTPYEQLESVLRLLIEENERLLTLTIDHRAAIAAADARSLGTCIVKQNEVVQRIAALERQRQGIVSVITRGSAAHVPLNTSQPTFSAVAANAPEPVRSRLNAVAGLLRDLLHRLHKEHQAMKMAAETLSSHMEGIMRQVYQRLSHAGTYARGGGGAGNMGAQVVSSVDLRS